MGGVPYPPQHNPGKVLGIVGLILGVVGLALWCAPYFGIFFAIAGLVCSIIGARKTPQGMSSTISIVGIVISAIAIAVSLLILLLMLVFWEEAGFADIFRYL